MPRILKLQYFLENRENQGCLYSAAILSSSKFVSLQQISFKAQTRYGCMKSKVFVYVVMNETTLNIWLVLLLLLLKIAKKYRWGWGLFFFRIRPRHLLVWFFFSYLFQEKIWFFSWGQHSPVKLWRENGVYWYLSESFEKIPNVLCFALIILEFPYFFASPSLHFRVQAFEAAFPPWFIVYPPWVFWCQLSALLKVECCCLL